MNGLRHSTLVVAGVMASASLLMAGPQRPLFRATAELVAVDATVTRGRNPVTGLAPDDFVLFDNGVRQDVESASQGTMPLDLSIVLDFSGSAKDDFPQFLKSAAAMQALLRADDRWRWLAIYMEGRELFPMRPATDPLPPVTRPGPISVTALHDTIFLALVRPSEPARRHLVVVFTDGNDTFSMLDGRRLPEIAGKADAVLHAVVSASPSAAQQVTERGPASANTRWRESQDALSDAVETSGGRVHRLTSRTEAFARIIEEFRSAYVLRYIPRGVDTPGWHELTVSLKQRGSFTIRARKGYERR